MKHVIVILLAVSLTTYPEWCKEYEESRSLNKEAFFCQGARVEKILDRIANSYDAMEAKA